MRKLLLFFLLFLLRPHVDVRAQAFSYLYIQGDKETPIYLKMEGEMQPRYGQHFSILPRLAPGIVNVEILFQQNKFLPQKFALRVPEAGQRSLLLTRRETGWALYDMQQRFYIPSGNTPQQDIYEDREIAAVTARRSEPATGDSPSAPPTEDLATRMDRILKAGQERQQDKPQEEVPVRKSEPEFIPDVTLSRGSDQPRKSVNKPRASDKPVLAEANPTGLPPRANADCARPMSIDDFRDFYGRVLAQGSPTARLTFLMDSDACPSPDQARIIARSLANEEARLRYLGRVIRRSAIPDSFLPLTNVFEAAETQENFRQLIRSLQ